MAYLSLFIAVLFGVGGQLLLKSGAAAQGFVEQLLKPQTIVGLGLYVFSALFYIIALRKLPVSIAFPSASIGYALVAVAAHFVHNEPLGMAKVGGILLIGGGVLLLTQA